MFHVPSFSLVSKWCSLIFFFITLFVGVKSRRPPDVWERFRFAVTVKDEKENKNGKKKKIKKKMLLKIFLVAGMKIFSHFPLPLSYTQMLSSPPYERVNDWEYPQWKSPPLSPASEFNVVVAVGENGKNFSYTINFSGPLESGKKFFLLCVAFSSSWQCVYF